MRLFRLENFELQIEPEALTIRAFAVLWKRDRSKSKQRATMELSVLYHMFDPRSDYMYIINESERLDAIKSDVGLANTWKMDEAMLEASVIYKNLTNTASSALLESTRIAIDKVQKFLTDIDLNATDGNGKPKYAIGPIITALEKIPKLAVEIHKAKTKIESEIIESSSMRGQKEKKMFEDGFISM